MSARAVPISLIIEHSYSNVKALACIDYFA